MVPEACGARHGNFERDGTPAYTDARRLPKQEQTGLSSRLPRADNRPNEEVFMNRDQDKPIQQGGQQQGGQHQQGNQPQRPGQDQQGGGTRNPGQQQQQNPDVNDEERERAPGSPAK
jgi:hypothetical protein